MPVVARSCKQPVAGVQWLHTDTSLKFYEYHYYASDAPTLPLTRGQAAHRSAPTHPRTHRAHPTPSRARMAPRLLRIVARLWVVALL